MAKEIVNSPKEINGLRVVQDGKEIMEALINGERVMHWESGFSMHPLLQNMEYCIIYPLKTPVLNKDFVLGKPVFCHFSYPLREGGVGDFYMVHRCTEIYDRDGEQYFRIEGTDGRQFGWTKDVYGYAKSTNIFELNPYEAN